jgi:hypothetical protein
MAGTLPPLFRHQFTDSNGDPLSSGTVDFYLAGTSTRENVYSDVALATPLANPYTLPSSGKLTWYFSPSKSYKIVVKDSSGNTVDTIDNIPAIPSSASNQDIAGTAGETLVAGECCYLSDGSGGKTAGSWFKADADQTYSSTTPIVGFAVSSIASGESGTFRLTGVITLAGPLTVGEDYYVSATAGAITSTAPSNARFVGVASSTTTLVVVPTVPLLLSALSLTSLTTTTTVTVGTLLDLSGATAGQIKFPATPNPSTNVNTLDEYEELTAWTPVIGGSGGTSGQAYSSQIAKAIKIGKHVTAWFDVTLSNKGTITGAVQIQGLPYTQGAALGNVHIAFWTALGAAKVYIGGIANISTTAITLYGAGAAATGLTALADADISNTTRLVGMVVYEADA